LIIVEGGRFVGYRATGAWRGPLAWVVEKPIPASNAQNIAAKHALLTTKTKICEGCLITNTFPAKHAQTNTDTVDIILLYIIVIF
jgi:hypothetical protein